MRFLRQAVTFIFVVAIIGIFVLLGCSTYSDLRKTSETVTPEPAPTPNPPDLSRILPAFAEDGAARLCPVRPAVTFTCTHVVKNSQGDVLHQIFSTSSGRTSLFIPVGSVTYADLAVGVTLIDVDPYTVADKPPLVGESLWWVGSPWTKGNAPRVYTGKIIGVVAGHIILDTPTEKGSSGSCLINARGEAVGVVAWTDNITVVAPGIWGELSASMIADAEKLISVVRENEKL